MDKLNVEPIFLYRSKDCKRQRIRMAALRAAKIERNALAETSTPKRDLHYPEISICLVTYNSQNWIENWFQALVDCGYPQDKLSLSIVDNGSTDDTIGELKRCLGKFDGFNLLKLHLGTDNLGFGRGQNIAMSNVHSEYVLVINPDALLRPGSLTDAVQFALRDESDICAWEFSQQPYEHPKYYDPVTLETSWNAHACVLLKKSAIDSVGGYDKSIFMYGEDVDLSYKLRRAGFRLRYLPKSIVLHNSLISQGKRSEQSVRIIAANFLLRRRYGKISDKLVGYLMFLRANILSGKEVKKTYRKAWNLYLESRSNFRSIKRENTYFPFNGFDFERRRPDAQVTFPEFNKDLPKISIITRVHKVSDTLGQALQTVKNQTYPNVEHVVVFDKCDPFLVSGQIVVQSSFATRSEAANAGALAASGQYLLFLDYDDLLFADHLEGLMSALRADPKAVCSYALSWEAMTDKRESGADKYLGLQNGMESEFPSTGLEDKNFFAIQSLLIHRPAFEKAGGFSEKFDKLEDWDLWKKLSAEGEFQIFPKVTSIFYTPSGLWTRFKRSLELLS